ncbi:MAG: hypothetical protein MUP58_02510 [Candidatus Nanohaloarchaeota archaeon QJJ-9]|nr:hypothetical protein [Candidatus Nanohaloarchaeota archaeon QJJ-9]
MSLRKGQSRWIKIGAALGILAFIGIAIQTSVNLAQSVGWLSEGDTLFAGLINLLAGLAGGSMALESGVADLFRYIIVPIALAFTLIWSISGQVFRLLGSGRSAERQRRIHVALSALIAFSLLFWKGFVGVAGFIGGGLAITLIGMALIGIYYGIAMTRREWRTENLEHAKERKKEQAKTRKEQAEISTEKIKQVNKSLSELINQIDWQFVLLDQNGDPAASVPLDDAKTEASNFLSAGLETTPSRLEDMRDEYDEKLIEAREDAVDEFNDFPDVKLSEQQVGSDSKLERLEKILDVMDRKIEIVREAHENSEGSEGAEFTAE